MSSKFLRNILGVGEDEVAALVWSFVYFFCLLCSYYVLRPIRDEMGIQGGIENLQWLFTATFISMLCMVPVFGWVSSRYSRAKLLPIVYGFFILNILLFYVGDRVGVPPKYLARVFFVWVSVFNLFVVSIFWSFMVDVFNDEQSKRLFGLIAAGGSAGALTGPALTTVLVQPLGAHNLLLVSATFLCLALACVLRLRRWAASASADSAQKLGGGIFDGVRRVVKSTYLLGICTYVLIYTTLATFLYFTQAEIIRDAFSSSAERTQVFAIIDLITNALTVALQVFATGHIARRLGLSITLCIVPFIMLIGFWVLSWYPVLAVLIVVQVVRRAGNYAIARPGREMLYSVLPRADKYKSKNFIDTVVYRGGDAASGWVYAGFTAMGMAISGIAWIAIGLAALWMAIGWRLGRRRREMEGNFAKIGISA